MLTHSATDHEDSRSGKREHFLLQAGTVDPWEIPRSNEGAINQ